MTCRKKHLGVIREDILRKSKEELWKSVRLIPGELRIKPREGVTDKYRKRWKKLLEEFMQESFKNSEWNYWVGIPENQWCVFFFKSLDKFREDRQEESSEKLWKHIGISPGGTPAETQWKSPGSSGRKEFLKGANACGYKLRTTEVSQKSSSKSGKKYEDLAERILWESAIEWFRSSFWKFSQNSFWKSSRVSKWEVPSSLWNSEIPKRVSFAIFCQEILLGLRTGFEPKFFEEFLLEFLQEFNRSSFQDFFRGSAWNSSIVYFFQELLLDSKGQHAEPTIDYPEKFAVIFKAMFYEICRRKVSVNTHVITGWFWGRFEQLCESIFTDLPQGWNPFRIIFKISPGFPRITSGSHPGLPSGNLLWIPSESPAG